MKATAEKSQKKPSSATTPSKGATKSRRAPRNGKNKSGKKSRATLWIVLAVAAAVLAGAGVWLHNAAFRGYPGTATVRVIVPDSLSDPQLKALLAKDLGTEFGHNVYRLLALRNTDTHRARGYYEIKPGERAWTVASRLHSGTQTPRRLTFNNIRTFRELAEHISSNFIWDTDSFMAVADTLLPSLGFRTPETFPAAFIPDTYEFYYTASPAKVIRTLVDYRNKFWNPERTALAQKLGLTPVEVAIVASIAEEETAKADELPKVARLYLNRIHEKMKLQADPTVKFAIGDFALRRISGDMLKTPSPFNTYLVEGLPPGPIRIADKRAINAVLNAPQHDFLYMCAKPDFSGYHNFTRDYSVHQANARAYQNKLNELNIKK